MRRTAARWTAKSCCPGAPTLALSMRARRVPHATVANKPGTPRRPRISRSSSRRECRMFGWTCGDCRQLFSAGGPWVAASARHSLRPLLIWRVRRWITRTYQRREEDNLHLLFAMWIGTRRSFRRRCEDRSDELISIFVPKGSMLRLARNDDVERSRETALSHSDRCSCSHSAPARRRDGRRGSSSLRGSILCGRGRSCPASICLHTPGR